MKKQYLQSFSLVIIMLLASGCKDGLLEEIMNRKGVAKKMQLQEMVHNGRHYTFVYDKRGLVDRIDVSQDGAHMYTYEATYKNKRLESAALVENGIVVSENHDLRYDRSGNITGYTYTWYIEDVPGGVSTAYDLGYDDQNRLTSVSSDGSTGQEFTYDSQNNIDVWTNSISETSFTYDDKFNPLYRVPDLFLILVEEPFFWEFILSEHNSLTRRQLTTYNMEVQNTTYTNTYDQYFRLTSKTDEEGNGFTFLYR